MPGETPKHIARVPLGTTFQKKFGREGTFVGTLFDFDPVEDNYKIKYEYDDVEELTWLDLHKLLRTSGDSITALTAVPPLVVEKPTPMSYNAALDSQKKVMSSESAARVKALVSG